MSVKRRKSPPEELEGQKVLMSDQEMKMALLRNQLEKEVEKMGGLKVAHAHLDRSFTNVPRFHNLEASGAAYSAQASLSSKQSGIGEMHRNAEFRQTYWQRMEYAVWQMANMGVVGLDTFIDTTHDEVMMEALEVAQALKASYAGEIELRLGAYNPFGFQEEKPERWEFYQEACKQADFVGTLPERDDKGNLPDHIGFCPHLEIVIDLAHSLDKDVYIHLDQMNVPWERGTWLLCEHLRHHSKQHEWNLEGKKPRIWAVHVISPSCYEDEVWRDFLDMLEWSGVGVVVCPKAAIGMRQYRNVFTPLHNCLARVIDMAERNIPVRFGIDNIADSIMPEGSWDILEDMILAASALRYYNPTVLAKLCTDTSLTQTDRDDLRAVIDKNKQEEEDLLKKSGERFWKVR